MVKKEVILKDKDIKKQELSAMLVMFYQSGFKQPQLFTIEETDEFKGYKKFRDLINREAKKRNFKPLQMIDYFADHRNELLQLLKTKDISVKKFPTIYKHSDMDNIAHELFKTRRPQNMGLEGGLAIWKGRDIEYQIKIEDLIKLKDKDPKVYVSQLKNISILLAMVQEQQYNNEKKEPICEFSRVQYARRRGHTEEQIKRGGKIFEEDRRDLITGAITTYMINKIKINGKLYTRYGIPNFYILDEPENPRDNLRVTFYNEPYRTFVMDILHGKAPRYFQENRKAIEDRYTDEHPVLFLFYLQLRKRYQKRSLFTWRIKVKDLFEDMKIDPQIIARPKKCFELLKECLIYFSTHYEPIPEIESFRLTKESQRIKSNTSPLDLSISEAFKNYDYNDFKDLLLAIKVKDIKEAYISFKRYPAKKKHKHFVLTEEDKELINKIMTWAKEWEEYIEGNNIPYTEKQRYKFLSDCIRYLGHDKVEDSFIEEQEREIEGLRGKFYHVDDPIGYFTKRLPEMLREDKAGKELENSYY